MRHDQLLGAAHTCHAKTQLRPAIWQGLQQRQPPTLVGPSQFNVMEASLCNRIDLTLRLSR